MYLSRNSSSQAPFMSAKYIKVHWSFDKGDKSPWNIIFLLVKNELGLKSNFCQSTFCPVNYAEIICILFVV